VALGEELLRKTVSDPRCAAENEDARHLPIQADEVAPVE